MLCREKCPPHILYYIYLYVRSVIEVLDRQTYTAIERGSHTGHIQLQYKEKYRKKRDELDWRRCNNKYDSLSDLNNPKEKACFLNFRKFSDLNGFYLNCRPIDEQKRKKNPVSAKKKFRFLWALYFISYWRAVYDK